MEINETPISDLFLVNTTFHYDSRGSFARFFCNEKLSCLLGERQIVQINHSVTTKKGIVRGMHFQYPPAMETKVVRCLKGAIFDVAVDLRRDSSTFLKWHAEVLSAENANAMVIPEGFAHGFQALEDETEMLYLHTAHYDSTLEDGLRFDDPIIGINWPLKAQGLSDRDLAHRFLEDSFLGIR